MSRLVSWQMIFPLMAIGVINLFACKTRQPVDGHLRSSDPDPKALAAFDKHCSGCHVAFGKNNPKQWEGIQLSADDIISRLDWDSADEDHVMPPRDSREYPVMLAAADDRMLMISALKASRSRGGGIATNLPLEQIKLPRGFKIAVYANVPGARSMTLGDDGTVYVGSGGLSGKHKKVYAVQDRDRDGAGESVTIIRDWAAADAGDSRAVPNGVAFKDGSLYVGLIDRIVRFDRIAQTFANKPTPATEKVRFPDEMHHGWKFIGFGPDGRLYVPVGAEGNMTDDPAKFSLIYRLSADMSQKEVFASGVRNSVGFDWHPVTKELWFTDNGRDNLVVDARGSDDIPPDELNHAPRAGLNFGFPFCHGGDITEPDPDYARYGKCSDAVPPVQKLGPHVAALGMRFYSGSAFPAEYKHQVFIAEHGSWNRSARIGYRVSLVRLEGNRAVSYEDFASGWLRPDGQRWGRPVDVLVMPDGSMLVSDDMAGVLYRITYTG
jgi:glucose/arabinose dehydrogenase